MTLYWGINLLSLSDQDIPLTHIRSANRSPDGGFSIGAGETESFHYIDLGAHQGESIAGFIEYLRYYNISEKYSLTSFEASRQAQIWCPLTHTAMKCEDYFSSMYISNYAIAKDDSICEFRDDGSAGSSIHVSKPLNKNQTTVLVPTFNINRLIGMMPDSSKEVIVKLNIEGAEYEVLDAILNNPASIGKVTEIWLDFHGHQFSEKWEYLKSELRILRTLESLGIKCFDVDFMSGFYYGYEKHPARKDRVSPLELINAYLD